MVATLLVPRRRDGFLDELVRGVDVGRKLAMTTALLTAGAAVYGLVLGLWRGGPQILYAAVKLPLVLLLTAAFTMVFNWMTAVLLGLRVRFVQVAVLACGVLAIAAVLLASLASVAWLFTVSAPQASLTARTTHNLLYLFHTLFVGLSGITGSVALLHALRLLAKNDRQARTIYVIWLLTFALVGGEVAWALRPFVGSIYEPVAFLRDDALDGNVYEFVFTDILPYLLGR